MQPDTFALSAQKVSLCRPAFGDAAAVGLAERQSPARDSEAANTSLSGLLPAESPLGEFPEVEQVFRKIIGPRQWEHWFQGKSIFDVQGDELTVSVHSPFLLKWMQKQFGEALQEAADVALGMAARVRMLVAREVQPATAIPAAKSAATSATFPASPVPSVNEGHSEALAMRNPGTLESSHSASGAAGSNSPRKEAAREGRRFADLTDFVVGPCNALAMTAARQVCQSPGQLNPLFVFGTVGNGKSHLLEGIYRQLRRTQQSLNVLYLTAEQFTNHFTQALREHTLPAFRQRFRNVDVLLIDDIDFLDAKRVVQEEFLHTFKQLASLGKQIVLSGDRHPRLLSKLSDELRTRFLSGMVCRLEPPDAETRLQIVTRKASRLAGEFTTEALQYIAERFPRNVRELEGAIHYLMTYQRMTGKRVGVTVARQVLSELERDCLKVVRLTDIEVAVCDLFGLSAADLKSSRRTRSLSQPRMFAMYLARKHTRAAYSEIGQYFGGRNHSTVIAAEQKIQDWLTDESSLKVASQNWKAADLLEALEQQLLAS